MATQLSIVNRILLRLREDQVTTVVDNDYSTLIAEFVNDSYEDVAEEYDWSSLDHNITVDLVAGTSTYNLSATVASGGGVRTAGNTRLCRSDSILGFIGDAPMIHIYEDSADDASARIWVTTRESFEMYKAGDRSLTDNNPYLFTFYASEDDQELTMEVYPEPAAAREVILRFHTLPGELTVDGTDDATVIFVPQRVVYLLALMYAYMERGEELGEPGGVAERRYIGALASAKEAAIRLRERTNFYEWRRD